MGFLPTLSDSAPQNLECTASTQLLPYLDMYHVAACLLLEPTYTLVHASANAKAAMSIPA